jgi:hypothetical protein
MSTSLELKSVLVSKCVAQAELMNKFRASLQGGFSRFLTLVLFRNLVSPKYVLHANIGILGSNNERVGITPNSYSYIT